MYLLNVGTGEATPGRCKSTNLCDYCAKLAAVENTELLSLDALHGEAANLYQLLTTRTATRDMAPFYRGRELILRAYRRRWPEARYGCLLEFTTGRGVRSGGQRRPHWNLLWKGIPDDARDEAREIGARVWCQHVDALAEHQDVQHVRDVGGLMRYVAMHFQKQSQSPPEGFRGHRFTASKGYLWLPTSDARAVARESLRAKRIRHQIVSQCPDLDPCTVEEVLEGALALDAAQEFQLIRTLTSTAQKRPDGRVRAHQSAKPDGDQVYHQGERMTKAERTARILAFRAMPLADRAAGRVPPGWEALSGST